ncbi:MAG: hypothetical protein Fur0037_12590 [Planctomycetota bacterium]
MLLLAGFALRAILSKRIGIAPERTPGQARLVALLAPLALLEAGMLLSCVVWLLNGNANPNLVVFAVLFGAGLFLFPGNGEPSGEV